MRNNNIFSLLGKIGALVGVVIAFVLMFFLAGWMREKFFSKFADKDSVKIVDGYEGDIPEIEYFKTCEEIEAYLNSEVDNGADGNIHIDIDASFTDDDIKSFYKSIDPFKGRVKSYITATSTEQDGDGPVLESAYASVNYDFVRSDEMYVYDSMKNGKEIPAERKEAAELKEVCEKFLKEEITESMNDYEKELAIHDFIINSCEYSDVSEATYQHGAYGALVMGDAWCEGYSRAAALLLRLCDIDAKLIKGFVGENPEGKDSNHMWNQVKLGNTWYHLDLTMDDPKRDNPVICHLYLNVSDDKMAADRSWDRDNSETCTSMSDNYFVRNKISFSDDESLQQYIRSELENGNRERIECGITSNLDLSDETLYFMFDYENVTNYMKYKLGEEKYESLEIVFNVQQ